MLESLMNSPTTSHISAPSELSVITSKQLSVDFFFQVHNRHNSKDFLECMIKQKSLTSMAVCSFPDWIGFVETCSFVDENNSLKSSCINEQSFLFEISRNDFKTESIFLLWLKWNSGISFLLIFLIINLPTLPSSPFAGLLSRHDGFCRN